MNASFHASVISVSLKKLQKEAIDLKTARILSA
jgi:hypothetical protein